MNREQRLEAVLRELNDHLSFGDAPSELLDRVDAILAEPAPAQDEQEIIGVDRYRVEPTGRGFWPFCVRAGSGERELFIGHRKTCEQVAAELATAFEDGKFVAARPAQTEQYPPCDYCGVIPDHHPWHGSGLFKGVDSPHIHACNDCRHLLPTRPAQTEQQPAFLLEIGSDGEYAVLVRDKSWLRAMRNKREYQEHKLYAAPIAQTAPQPEQSRPANKLRALAEIWDQNADEADEFGNAQAAEALRLAAFELRATMSAPQPED